MEAWLPLKIHSSMANTVEHISGNIETNLLREYTPFNAHLGSKSGAVAIVGSGPSLKANWKELSKFKGDILACNAAYQFLLERGITSNYMMCFDADPLMLEFITPHKEIIFLLASRCPTKAFEMLEGCNVVMWHAAGDANVESLLEKHKRLEPMITGGSAAVVRAMHLAQALGYREIHLYGADSSFQDGETHIRKSTTVERRMSVMVNGRTFQCAPWMAQQAEDFKILAPSMMNHLGIDLHVHGDGLIPHLALALGCKTDLEPRVKQVARQWKHKAKALWQNL
jgi:uncharacterized Rossmann fold enzyme